MCVLLTALTCSWMRPMPFMFRQICLAHGLTSPCSYYPIGHVLGRDQVVVTKVYPYELEPGYDRVLNGPSDYSLRVGFFDVNHGVFYPCNEAGTSVFVGTSYRRFLFDTKKRKGIAHDLNLMMRSKGGMYPWIDAKGKPHYQVCAAAQIFRINRHHE